MKTTVKLAMAGLLTALAATSSFADCNPPCKGNRVCRYDSTHNPPFFCRKPPTAQSATAPAPSPAAAAKPAPLISEVGFPNAKSTASPERSRRRSADNEARRASKWQPSEYDATVSGKKPARP